MALSSSSHSDVVDQCLRGINQIKAILRAIRSQQTSQSANEDRVAGTPNNHNNTPAVVSGPTSSFECLSTFFPEQYTVSGVLSNRISVFLMVEAQITASERTDKYFLIFAVTVRRS